MRLSRSFLQAARSAALFLVVTAFVRPVLAQEAAVPEAEAASRKIGFYFGMSLEKLSQLGQANGIGAVVDSPALLGGSYSVSGPEIDGDLRSRWGLGFKLGFRLRKDHGSIEGRFFQWDEQQDLLHVADAGKSIANTLADPDAGYAEDVGLFLGQGGPDGSVDGFEAGLYSEGSGTADRSSDGAEDLNYNRRPDFIRFSTSNRIVGELKTDYQVFDLSYLRRLKRLPRLELDGRFGMRVASASQFTDLGYRELGAFAVYSDDEGQAGLSERTDSNPTRPGFATIQDGDGDGETTIAQNEADGDGFFDGNGNRDIEDELTSVDTVSEDRIVADIKASGFGVVGAVDGRFELSKKWRLAGSFGVALLSAETEFRYRETFTSQRDRYPNFIDWDLNGDGRYDNLDFDFDGDCQGRLPCTPDFADSAAIPVGGVPTRTRVGAEFSYASSRIPGSTTALGVNANAYDPASGNANLVRERDPVPESERNRDIHQETTLLNDVAGKSSGIQPQLDINVGLEYQFSRFAHLDFGLRSTRWFGAGSFREIANDVIGDGDVAADGGDLSLTGMYFTVTIVPR